MRYRIPCWCFLNIKPDGMTGLTLLTSVGVLAVGSPVAHVGCPAFENSNCKRDSAQALMNGGLWPAVSLAVRHGQEGRHEARHRQEGRLKARHWQAGMHEARHWQAGMPNARHEGTQGQAGRRDVKHEQAGRQGATHEAVALIKRLLVAS